MLEKDVNAHLFMQYFSSKGYQVHEDSSLVAHDDDTLLFTNDTIAPWKNHLLEGIPEEGMALQQPCLRLQGMRDTICREISLEFQPQRFLGYFTSLGVLVGARKREVLQEHISELLLDAYAIDSSRVRIFGRKDMHCLGRLCEQFTVDTTPNKSVYYTWKYGLEGIVGKGATVGIESNRGEFQEVGQVIEICQREQVIGYEFGFGAETFTSRLRNDPDYSAWSIYHAVPESHFRFKTLLDTYSCMGAILSVPTADLGDRHLEERRRISRNIAEMEELFGFTPNWTQNVLDQFLLAEFDRQIKTNIREEINEEAEEFKNRKEGIRKTF